MIIIKKEIMNKIKKFEELKERFIVLVKHLEKSNIERQIKVPDYIKKLGLELNEDGKLKKKQK